jgi:hypothetical protein
MYQKIGTAAGLGVGGAGLAYTGVNVMWLLLGGFALLAAGSALLRIVPVVRRRKSD